MVGGLGHFLKTTWAEEPVLNPSFAVGIAASVLALMRPYTKFAYMINQATPYYYPVPLRDDGNMPDIPSHLQDLQGPSLQRLKNL